MKNIAALLLASAWCFLLCFSAFGEKAVTLAIDFRGERQPVSPYIFGINQYGNQGHYGQVTVFAVRQGGNRMTAYNWENNASSAGADWRHSSDNHLSASSAPGDCAQVLSREAAQYGIPYKLTTLQMAGWAAADKRGSVSEAETAPSARWAEVLPARGEDFSLSPDLTDGKVYMDEYVHFLTATLGDALSPAGIQAYSLDNEPALWHHTHPRIHPQPVGVEELIDRSVALSLAVKAVDPHAEIYGPALYGYTAFQSLADDSNSGEWERIKSQGRYSWFIDCYLDRMRAASEEHGVRLLDVLDVHYYSESARIGYGDRLHAARSLYEPGFRENSWIGQWCGDFLPLLPRLQQSIRQYWPGTRLAISEYSFGGEDISATLAQAEALGAYAAYGVYSAFLWGGNDWQFAGINLYTNYDGQGGRFGDSLIPAASSDPARCAVFAAGCDPDGRTVTVVLINRDSEASTVRVELRNTAESYHASAFWGIWGDSPEIRQLELPQQAAGSAVACTLPPACAAMLVLSAE